MHKELEGLAFLRFLLELVIIAGTRSKGELLYILWNSRNLPYPYSVSLDSYLIHWLSASYPR